MVLVWVLAFLLYGPAILSWEHLSGRSAIPEGQCYAEFFYNWYFLITASTLEFFTPFLSVTFFNLSIYLNIQRRTRDRLDGAREAAGPEPPPEAPPSPPGARGCWGCRRKGRGEAVPLHRCGVGEATPGPEAGEAALGGSGGGAVGSPTSSSGSSSRGTERPRSLKRGSKPSASSASLEKRMKMVSQSITQRFRLSRDKKVAKSLAVIVSIFGLCWAPYTLLMIIRAACHGRCVPDYWYETSFWLLWANSAVNPRPLPAVPPQLPPRLHQAAVPPPAEGAAPQLPGAWLEVSRLPRFPGSACRWEPRRLVCGHAACRGGLSGPTCLQWRRLGGRAELAT